MLPTAGLTGAVVRGSTILLLNDSANLAAHVVDHEVDRERLVAVLFGLITLVTALG